ncbi:QWRF motif-containing protein 7 isoform X2 [Lotus japonicus]|uniref:QWRF motif-containing protein 7 isoform X2 n=1 Tax=Lotus japonicus TaxID=34305 RepID=UPI002583AAF7|nr:QWRF motif-containing protein 7 isoform X2 [Lotus japonicus]
MEKSARTLSGRGQLTVAPPSPSPMLVRSRSGTGLAAITTPERRNSQRFSSSERFTNIVHRSKSTSKSRTNNNEGNINISKFQEKTNNDGFGKFLQRGVSPDHDTPRASRKATSAMKSPSAWALSPGRPPPFGSDPPAKAIANGSGGGGGGVGSGPVSKVLKYFKQRKVTSLQEEMYHQFRILHNRLLQWRFINARGEVAMANVKNVAEIRLFSVWLRNLMLRKIIIQKRTELQKVKHRIKLYHILNGQLSLLTEWAKLDRRNQESIGRLTRKLSALSSALPLTHGVKADPESLFEALSSAIEVMENIESLITKYQTQVERILYQVTELATTSKQEEEYLQELLGLVPIIATLLENEKNIQVHLIQTRTNTNNVFGLMAEIYSKAQ